MSGRGKHEAWQAVKFTLFSASAGIIEFGTFTLMFKVFGWDEPICHFISLVLSVLWNYTVNRRYTFRSDKNVPLSMLLVAAFYAVFIPASTWWTAELTKVTESGAPLIDPFIVKICTMLINFVTEFLYQKFVVYRNAIDTNERARKANKQDE